VHDRFANSKFGQLEKEWIINYLKETHVEDNLVFGGELANLHTHSDNAAQHFKSTGALEAYAALWFKHGRPTLSTYHFGCPGHGKGPWDGIGGWLKNSLHRMVKGAQTSLQNLPGLQTCALTCAYDVYKVFKNTYDCPKWRERISTSTTAKLMHIHFIPCVSDVMSPERRLASNPEDKQATPHNPIERYKEKFVTISNIRNSYQFILVDRSAYNVRQRACWCLACLSSILHASRNGGVVPEILNCTSSCYAPALYAFDRYDNCTVIIIHNCNHVAYVRLVVNVVLE
jgi:hypothetical protein